jgi:DMSO/TMAO reductase YedYZ molybdopterin-dependent catalytic subunit
MISRRRVLAGIAASASGVALPGCDRLNRSETFREVLRGFEDLNQGLQRTIMAREALAREFTEADLSPVFRGNGTVMPDSDEYRRLLSGGFADWRLTVDGLVRTPLSLSLDQLRQLPARTQITRHDCVEGWSAIGKWTGAPLGPLLAAAGLSEETRYIVFHCMDRYGELPYYESIDLIDAFHPQTILAYALNDRPLPVTNGAPLRVRVERQLGYKHAKYIHRIEARSSLDGLYGGKGGFWEDVAGYEWYAGI